MNPVRLRASSLSELFDCPARWEAKALLGMRMPSSGPATLGTAIHAGTAAFDQAVLDKDPISISQAADTLVDAIWKPNEEVDWGDDKPKDAEKVGLILLNKYCLQIAPRQTYAGVELECENVELTNLGLILTGTTDRVRVQGNKYGISDVKSGGRVVGTDGTVNAAGHAAQLGVYELLGEVSMGVQMSLPAEIIWLQTGKTSASQRTGTGYVKSPKQLLLGAEESPGLLDHASNLIHSGSFYGNPKSNLCSPKYCPRWKTCKYRG